VLNTAKNQTQNFSNFVKDSHDLTACSSHNTAVKNNACIFCHCKCCTFYNSLLQMNKL